MKANIFKLTAIGLISLLLLTGCGFSGVSFDLKSMTRIIGSGKVVTESRSVSEFDGLVVDGAGRIFIDQTGTESLTITTDENMLPYIETQVRDGKLIIKFKPNTLPQDLTDLTFRLTVKKLNAIDLNGAMILEGRNIDAGQLSVAIDGASAVKLAGKVEGLTVTLDGASAFDSRNLECQRAKVTNNGAGAALVRASNELNATINGMGVVQYLGDPQVTRLIRGVGVVSKR